MIVELSREFDDLPLEMFKPVVTALDNLLHAHGAGDHIFLPSRATLDRLGAMSERGAVDRAKLQSIGSRYSEYLGLARRSKFTVLAYVDGTAGAPEQPNQRKRVPLSYFSSAETCHPFKILVENTGSDGEIISLFCHVLAEEFGFSRPRPIQSRMGGGSNIGREFILAAKERVPFFCVVDSDMGWPGAPFGATAAALLRAKANVDKAVNEHEQIFGSRILAVREVENLVPPEIIRALFEDDVNMTARVDKLLRLESRDKSEGEPHGYLLRHVDLKQGYKTGQFFECEGDERSFLLRVWKTCEPGLIEDEGPDRSKAHVAIIDGFDDRIAPRLSLVARGGNFRQRIRSALKRSIFWDELEELVPTLLAFAASEARTRVY